MIEVLCNVVVARKEECALLTQLCEFQVFGMFLLL